MSQNQNSGDHANSQNAGDGQNPQDANAQTNQQQQAEGGLGTWFTEVATRVGIALIGLVLLLFALGQAFDVEILAAFGQALSSEVGRWLIVAAIAVAIIAGAARVRVHRRR